MQDKAVIARNTDRIVAYSGTAAFDFFSDVIDFREMNSGFIQAIYKDIDAFDATFQLFISIEYCQSGDTSMFAPYGSERTISSLCNAMGWRLMDIGYRYAQLRYKANSVTAGSIEILARGKK